MKIGIGYSEEQDSIVAAQEASKMALDNADGQDIDFALVFSTSAYDSVKLLEGLRDVLPKKCRIVSGHSVGIISNEFLAYDGYQVGVLVAELGEDGLQVFHDGPLNADGPEAVGKRLAKKIVNALPVEKTPLLLLYDSVDRSKGYFQFNMATPLLKGMKEEIVDWPNIAGCGLSGDMKGTAGHQIIDDEILDQQAIALLFPQLEMHTTILHGCKPNGLYHTITKANGAEILEIDGQPALNHIADLLGHDAEEKWKEYGFFITLGVNKGEKFGDFNEESYVNRLCLRVKKDNRSLVLFEPDLDEGTEVQLMRRSLDMEYIYDRVADLKDSLGDKEVLFALYIDCAGRAAAFSGMDEEEAYAVMEAVGPDIPLLGWYSGVELATVQDEVRALDWTGVLCFFTTKG